MKTLTKLLAVFLIVSISSGCSSPAPKVSPCIVNIKETLEDSRCHCSSPEGDVIRHPIEHCHKYTAFSPDDVESVLNFIDELINKTGLALKNLASMSRLELD